MIIVDRLLAARADRDEPIRVGMVGAGFMGLAIADQVLRRTPGMSLAAIANRDRDRGLSAVQRAGGTGILVGDTNDLSAAVSSGATGVTDIPELLTRSPDIDVVVEVTGDVEHGTRVVTDAIDHGTHVVSMNVELDATIGPLLASRADRAGVVYAVSDGDQPGVQINLAREVRGMGLTPWVCGNIKGLQDRTRTPATQAAFAARWGQNVAMVTSFADGTKISFEQASVANALGFSIERRGMRGADHTGHVDDLTSAYDVEALRALGGIVDYVVGASPPPGVFVLAEETDDLHRTYLELYKRGTGPLYSFYRPYHLCHLEVPSSIVRAVDLGDPVLRPREVPTVDVVTAAKQDLTAGTVLDGIGGFHTYGLCERAEVTITEGLVPMGLSQGRRLRRRVRRDGILTVDDLEPAPLTLAGRLRAAQDATLRAALANARERR